VEDDHLYVVNIPSSRALEIIINNSRAGGFVRAEVVDRVRMAEDVSKLVGKLQSK
jgi:hypothetical protein